MGIVEDFGFSFEEDTTASDGALKEDLVVKVTELEAEVERLYKNNREMYKKIAALLNNLKKNPEKPMIKWPNRTESIDKFIKEIEELREKAKK